QQQQQQQQGSGSSMSMSSSFSDSSSDSALAPLAWSGVSGGERGESHYDNNVQTAFSDIFAKNTAFLQTNKQQQQQNQHQHQHQQEQELAPMFSGGTELSPMSLMSSRLNHIGGMVSSYKAATADNIGDVNNGRGVSVDKLLSSLSSLDTSTNKSNGAAGARLVDPTVWQLLQTRSSQFQTN
ncbi:hypothetical protein LPJ66_012149, partial [Kickxella alabastrina]